jgi:teichuronic acid biosynthesis glycosyltransferase TuaC
MRIAVISTSYPVNEGDPSGHFVRTEVAALEQAGHVVTVIAPPTGGAFGWPGVAARVRENPWRLFDAARWAPLAALAVRQAAPERVVAHWAVPSGFPIAAGAMATLRSAQMPELELVSHGADVRLLRALPTAARERVVTTLLDRASRWRFVSAVLLDELEDALAPRTASALRGAAFVEASPLGPVDDVRAEARARRERLAGRRLYVCAGRLVPSKRVDKVIDYVASARGRDAGKDPVLVVLGDGPEKPRLERLAHRWHMDVRFLGTTPRPEALAWIGAADEVVHASHAEGLSTVVREAEHLGVPVTYVG